MSLRKLRFSIRGIWFEYECTPEELPSIVEVLMEKFGACNGGDREQPSDQENDPPSYAVPVVYMGYLSIGGLTQRVHAIPILHLRE